ncbi:MAG TPA: hypothetical protein VFH70_09290 [Acidimicrobiales bacterium]|nr:hypothetical protein [Acidimicrobiales bacterium]
MSWLIREGDVLAAVEPRRPGWTRELAGAVVLPGPALVHTLGSPTGLDVAWCRRVRTDGGEPCLEVRKVACLAGRRLALPRLGAGAIIAAAPGAFERWHLQVGDRLEVRES